MYEWCMNGVYMACLLKIVIVLSVLMNWNKIVNQSINQPFVDECHIQKWSSILFNAIFAPFSLKSKEYYFSSITINHGSVDTQRNSIRKL